MLAVIAAGGEHGVLRERIIALFWPESDEEHARQSARQAFYGLRQELGHGVIVANGASITLDPSVMGSDIADFRRALAAGDRSRAVAISRAPFLDGFYVPAAPAFERWAEEERGRLATARTSALVALAAESARDEAVQWWRELTLVDPLSGRFAVGLLKALAEQGQRAEGLAFARLHEGIIRRELDTEPDPEVRRLVAQLRAMPSPGVEPRGARLMDASRVSSREGGPPDESGPAAAPVTPTTRSSRLGLVAALVAVVAVAIALRFQFPPGSGLADAATTASPTAARLYNEGLRAIARDDVKSARQLMRAALEDDSTFAMAAYQEAILATLSGDVTPDGRHATVARRTALALAKRAPDAERMLITARLLVDDGSPAAIAVAESLAAKYPDDARALAVTGRVRASAGDWSGAVALLERAIALDSVAEPAGSTTCFTCPHLEQLGDAYLWSDSLDAAERTARRYAARRPAAFTPLHLLTVVAARRGDSAQTYERFRQLLAHNVTDRTWKLNLDLRLENYETFAAGISQLLSSSFHVDWNNGSWMQIIALRNQGRLREATLFHRTGTLPGLPARTAEHVPDGYNAAILAFERGETREAARLFRALNPREPSSWASGQMARIHAWHGALAGMALAAAGDTGAVRAMADSVEQWGRGSVFGRDPRLHHYLRGLLHAAAGRHADAVTEYQAAIYSPSLGFTRVNLEMARSLLALDRPADAVAILQPALRGEIDASNLYLTRTELHELLATAFDRAGQPDSAARHWRGVVAAWRNADPQFATRRLAAEQRLRSSTR